ncbi:haloacid dehalogenase-like hydrolase [Parasphingorhabdus sp.]|uniref:haloacid dehalogenase-like hydrolase n=1 Tax=Parasphingorhabdus sp. TaxID=2709688 RepID=UPI002B269404|nr:haloacid dehalogenase-like hydrolase [Parasphingorhabdus sp.]
MTDRKRTALIYDYDGTLAQGNIQENSFLPAIGMKRNEFWDQVKQLTKQHDADEILVYMQLMLQKAKTNNIEITKEAFRVHGKSSTLFEGLEDHSWFQRLNAFADGHGLTLEHYIISSGTQEMIEGSSIAEDFKAIFASRYIYDASGHAEWPSLAINYTTKTQFLFRINKGIDNVWDNQAINAYKAEAERPIPFSRMVFIGDGDTDIPAMKMTSHYGGHSIAAYDPERNSRSLDKIHSLIADGRVNFVAPADYKENAPMDILVKGILGRIGHAEALLRANG